MVLTIDIFGGLGLRAILSLGYPRDKQIEGQSYFMPKVIKCVH